MLRGAPKIRSSHKLTFFQLISCIAKEILRNLAVIGDMSAVVASIGGLAPSTAARLKCVPFTLVCTVTFFMPLWPVNRVHTLLTSAGVRRSTDTDSWQSPTSAATSEIRNLRQSPVQP
jgi:hypothetical protein